jgi:hypothetical protein
VYGRPTISHSPVSSGEPVADLKLPRKDATLGWLSLLGPRGLAMLARSSQSISRTWTAYDHLTDGARS